MKVFHVIQLIILFILLHSAKANCQEYKVEVKIVVIAENGLNLRSAPNKKASVLTKMPYFSAVEYVGKETYGLDTAEVIQSTGVNPQVVTGIWMKIKYQNIEGYALNSYLYRRNNRRKNTAYNNTHVLLLPGWGCNDNLVDKRKFNWYGAYAIENGIELRKVDFQYINSASSMADNGIIVKGAKEPIFIMGSIKKIKEKRCTGLTNIPLISHELFQNEYVDTSLVFGKSILFDSYHQGQDYDPVNYTCIRQGKTDQIISSPENEFGHLPRHLIWEGDLDDDGLLDYIMTIGEKSSQTVLFLSSERKKGELVRAVASFYAGYCC